MQIIDISQPLHAGMTVYPGDPPLTSRTCLSFLKGDGCEVSEITIGTHCGTHIDAPRHMIPGGKGIAYFPLDCFIGPCRVLTIPNQEITQEMLAAFSVKTGERILLRTDPKGIYHETMNPAALSLSAAAYLAEKKVKLVGIDSPSVENMEDSDGRIHRTLLAAGIAVLEGLRLHEAKDGSYLLSALPLHLAEENGAPCRAVLVKENDSNCELANIL